MTTQELYEKLVKMQYNEQDINQLLKAKEEGYEICNIDIKMTTEQIREFRKFLKENIEVGLDHTQLREILLGWMKKLDISVYCDKKYSGAEMSVLRKAIENNKDVELLKKYGVDKKSMLEISRAMGYGCTEKDFQKYTIDQLKLFNDYQKKKVDLRDLLDRGFNKEQIDYILQFEKKHKDFSTYITKDFYFTTIMTLGYLLDKFPYETIKPLFQPHAQMPFISMFEKIIDKNITGWEKYAQAEYYDKSMLMGHMLLGNEKREFIDLILDSKLPKHIYSKIQSLFYQGKCPREQMEALYNAAHEDLNMDNLLIEGFNAQIYPMVLELERFNKENDNIINVKSLVYSIRDPEKFKQVAEKLISPSLDDKISGYSQIPTEKGNQKEINIEK